MSEGMVKEFEGTIYAQLRTLGVELYDDAGNRMKPGGPDEKRVVNNIARNIAQIVVTDSECQTPVATSCKCQGDFHVPSCPEYPAYLKDA